MMFAKWRDHKRRLKAPRITGAELDRLQARLAAATLPVAWVTLVTEPPPGATTSRIGGRPYADSPRRKWPVRGKECQPMLFLAQINFAEVPPLEDFPRKGLLQLFGLTDKRGDLEFMDKPADRVIRWYPDPEGTLTLPVPDALSQLRKRGSFSQRLIRDGFGMTFAAGTAPASPYNWPYFEDHPDIERRMAENEEVERRVMDWDKSVEAMIERDGEEHRNWIGGHPRFVQEDVRSEPRLRKLNRVLLHLSSDDDICIGDAGELNLMISRKDLRNLQFDKAYYTWDCS
jgi:uncharacterized protein YwqG